MPDVGRARSRWLSWLVGLALIVTLIVVIVSSAEERQLYQLTRQARPWWLLVALALQAATYFFQGEIWRVVTRAAGFSLAARTASWLGLGKLFLDQALPTAGISGNVLMVKNLEGRGVPRPVALAGVVVDTVSCYATYVVALVAALVITVARKEASGIVLWVSIAFVAGAAAATVGVLVLTGTRAGALADKVRRLAPLRRGLELLEAADAHLARSPRLIALASLYQLAILLLDAATIWSLIAGFGAHATASGVFASFMISTLFRMVGVIPGGLGVFEAASVLTLKLVGVAGPVALAATLLFRGLSFWLPLLPGVWSARRGSRIHRPSHGQRASTR